MLESGPACFNKSFLSSPAFKEGLILCFTREPAKNRVFSRRKEEFSDLICVSNWTNMFNIHTYPAIGSRCIESQFYRMRHTDAEPLATTLLYSDRPACRCI